MDKKIFEKIFQEAVRYGIKRRLSQEQAEDFAQSFIMYRYVKRTDKKINHAFADYLRSEYGDTRQPGNLLKSKAMKTYAPIKDEILGSYRINEGMICWQLRISLLKKEEQKIIRLKWEGHTLAEIANQLGVSIVAIHLRLKSIRAKLQCP